jgi:prevent-host-death family protein
MEHVGVRELNQHTSSVLAKVRRGESVVVTDHGKPVARLVPISTGQASLDELVARGLAVAPTEAGPMPIPQMLGDPTVDVAAALAAARDLDAFVTYDKRLLAAASQAGLTAASPGA